MTIVPFLNKINGLILNPLIYLAFVLAFVYFVYGVVKFLSLDDGDKSRDEAKNAIIWGIVGMIIMFSVYGLIHFILNAFGVENTDVSPNARQYIKI